MAGPEPHAPDPSPDPSMEDILASIRRILDEEPAEAAPAAEPPDELVLDRSMLVEPLVVAPVTPAVPDLLEPQTAEQATEALRPLARLALDRATQISTGGPTLEDMVREELRPLLKQWLDMNLPPLIERVVRGEIERLVNRAER